MTNRISGRKCSSVVYSSVAEPPHVWAAPAPEVRGPGADSGSDLIGSSPAPYAKMCHFELLKVHY